MSIEGLVYVGKIIKLDPITGADFIASATVVCGQGGKWRGVCKKLDFQVGSLCVVYLPDALIPESENMKFMAATGWRVKMRRFKGAPSEVVIMPISSGDFELGADLTLTMGVKKYFKPIPVQLQGVAKGDFPQFIPKTDELNYQRYPDLVESLLGKPYYITEKCDGSSTTAYRWKGNFGVCSRNLETIKTPSNGYWQVAEKHNIEELLPEGIAIQWETCGPGIQKNPMGLKQIDGFLFSGYNIEDQRYLDLSELLELNKQILMPFARILERGDSFKSEGLETLGEGLYSNGKQREGVVVRSQVNYDAKPISFKVINLDYEK